MPSGLPRIGPGLQWRCPKRRHGSSGKNVSKKQIADVKGQLVNVFEEFVFKFIQTDIEREIWLATHGGPPYTGGGNFLAALGLTCYTEFLGSFVTCKRSGSDQYRRNWEAFISRMGSCYENAVNAEGRGRLWDIYRNGFAHEYAIKKHSIVRMVGGGEDCGIGKSANGQYYFVVKRYYEDFMKAARELYQERLKDPCLPK